MTSICIKRGTTNKINEYVGKEGELVFDTEAKALYVMDGTNKGGHLIGIPEVVDGGIIPEPAVMSITCNKDIYQLTNKAGINSVKVVGKNQVQKYNIDEGTYTLTFNPITEKCLIINYNGNYSYHFYLETGISGNNCELFETSSDEGDTFDVTITIKDITKSASCTLIFEDNN